VTKPKTKNDLTPEELEEQNAEELPERAAMSVIRPGLEHLPQPIDPIDPIQPVPDT
jgi:hypothetical protein